MVDQPAVAIDNVSIVFGDNPEQALPLMDALQERGEIQSATGQVLGVHDCTLTVNEGEILVLMGLSGSGKSTLLRAINGLNPVVRGSVSVNDGAAMVNVTAADPATLRRIRQNQIAMVFQQFGLLPWRTVQENVGLGLELSGLPRSERASKVDQQLALVGLSDWADRKVGELSGGMQQRVGLARAFATDAPILLMDEPFSALDPLIRTRLQDELLDLQKELRRTIIFVSHDLDEAFKLGNRIAIMEGGRIVQCGTPQEIFSAPANDYVADFVAHMNPLGVLCARDVMEPVGHPAPIDSVEPDMMIQDVMTQVIETGRPVGVMVDGEIIGQISGDSVLAKLLDPRGS
ncbi:MAG: choline ABC transporter ATP-binding protein [Sedimentitalea sp.]|uniref:choline ABC transporter ATP-binding protein n=1 Tax=Sedimentitalea sp. TaxID=2048915 RepID=UPI003267237E